MVKKSPTKDMFWVGIGASAGGLEALRNFVRQLPEESNMTYIVVQHLSPQHRSMLVDLIARETNLVVKEFKNGEVAKTNTIYITSPNRDVYLKGHKLYLKEPRQRIGPKPSVDYFFNSLAEEIGEKAIGIILSGTGSDGSRGIMAIRAAGGITIAQDDSSAKYNGMPSSAVATNCVDLVLPPQEIAKELASIVQIPRDMTILQKKEEHVDKLTELLQKLRKRSGVDFSEYKVNTLHRRIERRMAARGVMEIDEYLGYIHKNSEELDLLFKDILISVTAFFRDKESFDSLSNYLKQLVKEKESDDRIRVWVPGCATGEEAYSIAIILAEHLGGLQAFEESNVQIFATDLDVDALDLARKGIYPEAAIEGISPNLMKQYFRQNANNFEVARAIRDKIVFAKHNVIEDPPFSRIDLVACRNLLIYFNSDLQKRVLHIFRYALNKGGLLFLGKSESLGQSEDIFRAVDSKFKIYKCKVLMGNGAQHFAGTLYPVISSKSSGKVNKDVIATQGISEAIIRATNPHSLLINDAMDIRHVYGDVQNFTQLQSGQTTLNVMNLVKKEFQQEIRALVYKSLRKEEVTESQPKKMKISGAYQLVQFRVIPLDTKEPSEKLLLISFEVNACKDVKEEKKRASDIDPRISELEQELASTREHLQTVIEELETSNEELQSLNEELQSSNEELQSSNEELETSNEELQSTNEELTTVNEELQVRSHELVLANNNLNNVKDSIDFPIVLVDKDIRVTLSNEASKEIFSINEDEKNQIITSIPTKIDLPKLRQNISGVIKLQKIYTEQIDTDFASYWLQITPFYTNKREVNGAVLAFVNNTETRRAEILLAETEARFRSILDHTSSLIYMKDLKGHFVVVNKKFEDLFDKREGDIIGSSDYELIAKDYAAEIRKNDESIINTKVAKVFEEVIPHGDALHTYISVKYPLFDHNGKMYATCGILTDITDRKLAEEQLNQANEELMRSNSELDDFAYVTSHDLKEPLRGIKNYAKFLLEDCEGKLDDDADNKLQTLVRLSERMQALLDNLLHFSRVGRMDTETQVVDLNAALLDITELLHLAIEEAQVDIRIPRKLPPIVCNPVRVNEIFRNLISNAIKFNDKKDKWVEVGYEGSTDGSREIVFFVRDNGIGIDANHSESIFSIFRRLHPKDKYGGGIGAGLTITKKIIEYYNGRIWLESEPDKGSTFYFTIGGVEHE